MNLTDHDHPSDGALLAIVHGEQVDGAAMVAQHARACATCAARQQALADDDALIAALLTGLDQPPRSADMPRFARPARPHWIRRGVRIAGPGALLAAAAAALALPASPLHRRIFTARPEMHQVPVTAVAPPAAASGIAVPASRSLTIVFQHEQATGILDITRTPDGDVTFRSRGGNTAYQVGSGRVAIENLAPADTYVVAIPRAVQVVRVLVGARVLLRWPEDSAQRSATIGAGEVRIPLATEAGHAH